MWTSRRFPRPALFETLPFFCNKKIAAACWWLADNRLIGIVGPRNFLGVTIDLLQDREELKFDDLDEVTDIGVLDEGALGDIFVNKPETENWNQMDV